MSRYLFSIRLDDTCDIDDLKYHIKNLKKFKGRGSALAVEFHEELLRKMTGTEVEE